MRIITHGVGKFQQYAISNYCEGFFLYFYLFEAMIKNRTKKKSYKNVKQENVDTSL